ncbi:helix-turn-helix transcriptional regulator [Methylobacterium sp. J-068]|nr:helix-turn-helix transcriptional regulator [Methylobacterium sp. J-068]
MSPSALAKSVGISSTTLTRPLNNSNYKFNLSTSTMEKIAKHTGISLAPFFENADLASKTLALLKPGAYDPEIWKDPGGDNEPHKSTVVIGRAGYGIWYEARIHIVDFFPSILLTSSHEPASECFAVYIADSHVEPIASFNDYLFCIRWNSYKTANLDGMPVIVERKSEDGRLIELTMRMLRRSKNSWILQCANRKKEFQTPIELESLPGTDATRVIGIVNYVIRYPILP